jgi:hypothetical protein
MLSTSIGFESMKSFSLQTSPKEDSSSSFVLVVFHCLLATRALEATGSRRRTRTQEDEKPKVPVKAFSEEYRRQICPDRLVVQPRAHQRHGLDDSKPILEAPTEKV